MQGAGGGGHTPFGDMLTLRKSQRVYHAISDTLFSLPQIFYDIQVTTNTCYKVAFVYFDYKSCINMVVANS